VNTPTTSPRWVREPVGDGLFRHWRVDDVLFEGRTAFQEMLIARTAQGVSLFCEQDRQSTEESQLVYHEALMVPAFLLAEKLERVLVIGSSEGVACQMAAEAGASVDHVDIDEECVRRCAELLPYGYTPRELAEAERTEVGGDGRIRMHFADGYAWTQRARPATYDVIVVDLPDERADTEAQHNRLYHPDFLRICARALAEGGVLAAQAGCQTMWRNETLRRSWVRFNEAFPTVAYYGSDEHEWAFLFGRTDEMTNPTAAMIERLPSLDYRPRSIDEAALIGNGVPPYRLRYR
jgi:spermidine synthase